MLNLELINFIDNWVEKYLSENQLTDDLYTDGSFQVLSETLLKVVQDEFGINLANSIDFYELLEDVVIIAK